MKFCIKNLLVTTLFVSLLLSVVIPQSIQANPLTNLKDKYYKKLRSVEDMIVDPLLSFKKQYDNNKLIRYGTWSTGFVVAIILRQLEIVISEMQKNHQMAILKEGIKHRNTILEITKPLLKTLKIVIPEMQRNHKMAILKERINHKNAILEITKSSLTVATKAEAEVEKMKAMMGKTKL